MMQMGKFTRFWRDVVSARIVAQPEAIAEVLYVGKVNLAPGIALWLVSGLVTAPIQAPAIFAQALRSVLRVVGCPAARAQLPFAKASGEGRALRLCDPGDAPPGSLEDAGWR